MKLLNRVLALEPDNVQVSARLERIARVAHWKRRSRRASGAIAGAALLAGLAWGIVAWRAQPPPLDDASRRTEAQPTAAQSATGSATARAAPAAKPPPTSIANSASPPPRVAPGASAQPLVVSVHVSPYAQRALLDGVEVARGEGRVTFTLAPDAPHRIRIEHACCFPFVKYFAAGEVVPQPLELKERLKPRPARLRVEGDPQARVYVEGKLVGSAGESQRAPLEVPVPPTGDSPYDAPAELRVERAGQPSVRTTLRLRAGADVTFAAPEPEPPAALPAEPAPARQQAPAARPESTR
jgi:hypothetical protein